MFKFKGLNCGLAGALSLPLPLASLASPHQSTTGKSEDADQDEEKRTAHGAFRHMGRLAEFKFKGLNFGLCKGGAAVQGVGVQPLLQARASHC